MRVAMAPAAALLLLPLLAPAGRTCSAFSPRAASVSAPPRRRPWAGPTTTSSSSSSSSLASSSSPPAAGVDAGASPTADPPYVTTTAFDFSRPDDVGRFERIDDAIMGGISLSALRDVEGEDYASWRGVCRTDGGGFCGMRTLPFREALDVGDSDGIFLDLRLASDDEPDRRVWKASVRTDSTSRGEMVYQAEYRMPATSSTTGFGRVRIPFSDFVFVRGPRVVPDAPPLDTSGGIFQVGMTLSKFQINANTTTMEDFRDGFFDVNIRSIGFYTDGAADGAEGSADSSVSVEILSKKEIQKKKPVLLKVLLPLSKLFFSEQSNRRKIALKKLQQNRGISRIQAIKWGIKTKASAYGVLRALAMTTGIIAIDSFRIVLGQFLKLCLFYPLVALSRTIKFAKKKIFRMEVKELPSMSE